MSTQNTAKRALKTPAEALALARIIWFALFTSQVMYLVVGQILFRKADEPELGFMVVIQKPMGLALVAVGAMLLAVSFILPKLIKPDGVAARPGTSSDLLDPATISKRLHGRIFRFIVGAVVNESVALIGLAGGYVALKNAEFGSLFIFAAMAAMLARWPTIELFSDPIGTRR